MNSWIRSVARRIAWLVGLLPLAAGAGPVGDLHAFADGLDAYRAEFEQHVLDTNGRLLEESRGVLVLKSPDRFRWHYQEPYEQLIVADGDKVWIHDVDLEQVTVKDQDTAERSSPLYVLTDPSGLEERFEIEDRGLYNGSQIIGLIPRTGEEFEWVELVVAGNLVESITIQDSFGQQTRIRFLRPHRNPEVDPAEFTFEPPEGVDVIGEAELEFGPMEEGDPIP